jgi:RHS repeat-associated protein
MFHLPETGLYLTHYRLYDPDTGRWLNRDPIGEIGGLNLYGYVGGNPVNFVDTTGETAWAPAIGLGIRVIGGRAAAVALGKAAARWLGPPLGAVAVCLLAGVCSLNEADEGNDEAPPDEENCPPPASGESGNNITGQRPSKTPNTGIPGTTVVNPGSGQTRTYGLDGKPVEDIDWDHDHGQGIPHRHPWIDGVRQPGVPIPSDGANNGG